MTWSKSTPAILLSLLLASTLSSAEPSLVRIVTKSAKNFVGELIEESPQELRFLDLTTGKEQLFKRDEVKSIVNPFAIDDAVSSVGIPKIIAWRVGKEVRSSARIGKIAKVTSQVLYVTLGKGGGIELGTRLAVYRRGETIKNPDSKLPLAVERPRIATLEVVEVHSDYCKAKILGSLEVQIVESDEVQRESVLKTAVLSIPLEDGSYSNVGEKLTDDLTNALVQDGISTIEQTNVSKAIQEIDEKSIELFEKTTAKAIGESVGADLIVAGKITRFRNSAKAYIRLINVSTGEVVFATTGNISSANLQSIDPSTNNSKTEVTTFRGRYANGTIENQSSIQLEKEVPGDFELRLNFTKSGADAIVMMLPIGESNVQLVVDQEFGKLSGLSYIDGKEAAANGSRTSVVTVAGENALRVQVFSVKGKHTVRAWLNERPLTSWTGTSESFTSVAPWRAPDRTKVAIGTTNCEVKISEWSIKRYKGK